MSTYPSDVRHVRYLLPHQIRVWQPLVDRFVVTIDTHQSRSGRYRSADFQKNLELLRQEINEARARYPQLEVMDVDYSAEARREVARYFFGTESIPIKAWDGGPFYSYFFGMYAASAQYIVHFDADMLFGGASNVWLSESIEVMRRHSDILFIAPFPGPPRSDARIFGHRAAERFLVSGAPEWLAYKHRTLSTRVFMLDLSRLKSTLGVIPMASPSISQRLKARLLGNPPQALDAELVLTRALERTSFCRLDFLGSGAGMWSLHPPYRSEEFYRRLPALIRAVETGNVPDEQRGNYDVTDSMVDWQSARAANRWYHRYLRMLRHRLSSEEATSR